MVQTAAQVQPLYTSDGFCAQVDNEAVNGTAPAYYPGVGTWTQRLQTLLSTTHYDAVVAFFQGNGSSSTPENSDALLAANETETLNMVDAAKAAGVPLYWSDPMLSAFLCQWGASFNANGYEAYRQWVTTELPALRPGLQWVNENVLTPAASPTQRGPATYNDSLSFTSGVQKVRVADCLHLADQGPSVAAYEIVYATQGLWGNAPVHSSATTPVAPPILAPNVPVPAEP